MYRRPIIIGECPSKGGDPSKPIEGRVGQRLARYANIPFQVFLDNFDRLNILVVRPDDGTGLQWDEPAARVRARALRSLFDRKRIVILLGKRVAKAFSLEEKYFELQHVESASVYVIPHPSGLNRWYNDPFNELEITKFMNKIVKEVGIK